MDAKVDGLECVKDSVRTFLSDLEAPDPVHPVVYSPYGMESDYQKQEWVKAKLAHGATYDEIWQSNAMRKIHSHLHINKLSFLSMTDDGWGKRDARRGEKYHSKG